MMLETASAPRRGSSMLEFALLLPWYVVLFIGAFDYAFYAYSYIATENAARVAAMYCSNSSSLASNCSTVACTYALAQLKDLPNITASMVTNTTCSSPLTVSTSMVTGANSPDGQNAAVVTVTYTTPSLIPFPGYLAGTLTFSRSVTMRVMT